jgi:hypothetical protein
MRRKKVQINEKKLFVTFVFVVFSAIILSNCKSVGHEYGGLVDENRELAVVSQEKLGDITEYNNKLGEILGNYENDVGFLKQGIDGAAGDIDSAIQFFKVYSARTEKLIEQLGELQRTTEKREGEK